VLLAHRLEESRDRHAVELDVMIDGKPRRLRGEGNGPLDAALSALGLPLSIHSFEERSLGTGGDARAVAFIEIASPDMAGTLFGAGCSSSIVEASLRALISAANRLVARDKKLQEVLNVN
jgi:2-isopropylmalate synthase